MNSVDMLNYGVFNLVITTSIIVLCVLFGVNGSVYLALFFGVNATVFFVGCAVMRKLEAINKLIYSNNKD